jgi:hypothetical protein
MCGVAMDSNHAERECHSDLAVGRRQETVSVVRNNERCWSAIPCVEGQSGTRYFVTVPIACARSRQCGHRP